MKLIKQTSDNCLVVSMAMLLDTEPEELILEIGHDGTEVWYPDRVDSSRQRSFHIQEMTDCALRRGYALAPVEMIPRSQPVNPKPSEVRMVHELEFCIQRFIAAVKGRAGLMICQIPGHIVGHACAWDGGKVYDPNGVVAEIEDYEIAEMWLLTKLI